MCDVVGVAVSPDNARFANVARVSSRALSSAPGDRDHEVGDRVGLGKEATQRIKVLGIDLNAGGSIAELLDGCLKTLGVASSDGDPSAPLEDTWADSVADAIVGGGARRMEPY